MAAGPVIRIAEFRVGSRKIGSETTIRATGEITLATSGTLERTLRKAIPEFKCVVLDLSNVRYIDNFGLGTLLTVYMYAKKADCDLEIANPEPRLKDRLRNWLNSVFEGHQEYLGMTPD
jgi:anti-anti-sigma factor